MSDTTDTSDFSDFNSIFGIMIICINELILLPVMIYCGYKFYKKSQSRIIDDNEVFFSRRHPSTIYALIIFCILFVSIERPLNILIWQLNIIQLPYEYGEDEDPFQFFSFALFAYAVYYTYIQRFWMVFYTYKYYVAHAKLVWKLQLNPEYDENDNFFFANIEGLGSFSYTSPCFVILWMFTVILLPISTAVENGIPFDIATFFLLLPPFLILAYIAYRISPITDQYYIRDELVYSCFIMGIALILHLLVFLCVSLPFDNTQSLQVLLGSFIKSIEYTLLCYIITIWVLKKNDKYHVIRPSSVRSNNGGREDSNASFTGQSNNKLSFFPTPSNTNTSTPHSAVDLMNDEKGIRKRKLHNLLKTKHGFNLFMMHLTVELSVENLLFICEYVQYKKQISKKKLNGKMFGWIESLPNEFIPRCEAITKYPDDYLSQIHLIFEKYICWGSPLELNISARRRKRILKLFDQDVQENKVDENLMKKGWKQLSMIYDPVAIEIWKLMNDSFGRILETEKYETWHKSLPKTIVEEEDKIDDQATDQQLTAP